MFLRNALDIDDTNEPLLKRCKQLIENNERTDVTHVIMKRGDNALEINNVQYDIEEVDACLDGTIISMHQDHKHRLYFDTVNDNVHIVLPIKHQKDTNISTFAFQPRNTQTIGGEQMASITEKVVGTTFREHKHYKEYFALNEDIENGVSAITTIALLIPEPDNAYDPNAVMVVGKLANGQAHQIGYLRSAARGGELQLRIKQPQQASLRILAYSDNGDFNDTYTVTVEIAD